MEQIISYIKQHYDPLSILLYGSYANGTNNLNSDFDALVIARDHERFHDTSFVDGIQLDVFVYPAAYFDGGFDCEDFVQIYDASIVLDKDGRGKELQTKVLSYLRSRPEKSQADLDASVDWCVKMLHRVQRGNAEGLFRWHWVLVDSLEIYCDLLRQPYRGPKKALRWMEDTHPEDFSCYKSALEHFTVDNLERWITRIKAHA